MNPTASNKRFWIWGLICAVLWSCATLGVLLAQAQGGFGWWVLLIHPRDPATLLGMLTAPLFSATLYEWINNTCVMFVLIVAGSFHGWRFVRDGAIVWVCAGLSVWAFGNSELYHMGVSPMCYAVCAWLMVHSLVHRNMVRTAVALLAAAITLPLFELTWLAVIPTVVAIVLGRR